MKGQTTLVILICLSVAVNLITIVNGYFLRLNAFSLVKSKRTRLWLILPHPDFLLIPFWVEIQLLIPVL